jgi:hypothetical protein
MKEDRKDPVSLQTWSLGMKNSEWNYLAILFLSMLAVYLVVMSFTGIWPLSHNTFNSYSLQAQAWLSGRLDVGQNYSYLELARFGGKYYVSFPPFPSVVVLPFVLIFGADTPDNILTLLAAFFGAFFAFKTAVSLGRSKEEAVFWSLFVTIGSNFLFLSFNGMVWFMAQTFAFALCMAAIYFAVTPVLRHGHLALGLLACAVGCRPFQLIYLPVLIFLLYKKLKNADTRIQKGLVWLLFPALVAIFCMALNFARFGNPLEFGHNYLPEFMNAQNGQFSPQYILGNLPRLLLPPSMKGGKVDFPEYNGFAFYLASPIFISIFIYQLAHIIRKGARNKIAVLLLPALIFLHFLLFTMHKTMGGWHFGNRYTVDALPFAFLSLLLIMGNRNYKKLDYALFFLGLALNVVGAAAVYNRWFS